MNWINIRKKSWRWNLRLKYSLLERIYIYIYIYYILYIYVLSDNEIRVLEKGLDFAPIQRKINEPKFRSDFGEFRRRVRIKWHFRNELTFDFSEKPAFHIAPSWNPPKADPYLEIFLSRVKEELFTVIERPVTHFNLSQEEWKAIKSLADVVICDRNDYIVEVEKQLSDKGVQKHVGFKAKNLCYLVAISNRFFCGLKLGGHIWEKEMKHFMCEYKKVTNLGKLYLLPKIHKRLYEVPGRHVISNCVHLRGNCQSF